MGMPTSSYYLNFQGKGISLATAKRMRESGKPQIYLFPGYVDPLILVAVNPDGTWAYELAEKVGKIRRAWINARCKP
jgi:hypothetical protein